MFTFLSLITSIKDYVEVVHKLIETDSNFAIHSYYDFGSAFTFVILTLKDCLQNFLSFQWVQNFWSIPTIVPDVASSLISEISVFDGYFKNTQTFLESPFSYGNQNFFIYCLEKFTIGFLNSLFLCFPTSIAHIITLRRFVMQGLEAGFLSGLGTIVGNIVWIGSILFGFRFFVIPWLSLDLFRYFLGFLLIVKYMWDSSREKRMVLEDFSKYKIFFLTFLLSFTEQTTLYPYISNLSFGSDATLLESFPTESFSQFTFVHCSYLLGLLLGSLSLLQFTCWFWENPAFQIYMWFLSSFQITKSISSKFINFLFLYFTMICAIANFSYFGLDYTLTNPLGFVHEDRLFEQKAFLETAFLNSKASDRNTRRNRGRHGRRERWKRRIRKYRTFDASLYDQGIYDLFTIEDLNYGFDRFWLRRKIRNHRVRFRFFPGPWMRNFKKQLARPRLESYLGPRVEFFRILFEQAYHPEFHEFATSLASRREQKMKKNIFGPSSETKLKNFSFNGILFQQKTKENQKSFSNIQTKETDENLRALLANQNFISWNLQGNKKERILKERSAYRKFTRKIQTRLKKTKIEVEIENPQNLNLSSQFSNENSKNFLKPIFSKTWKTFAGIEKRNENSPEIIFKNSKNSSIFKKSEENFYFQRFYKKLFTGNTEKNFLQKGKIHFSKKEQFLQRYKNFLMNSNDSFKHFPMNNKTNEKTSSTKETKNILFSSPESAVSLSEFQKNNKNVFVSNTEKEKNSNRDQNETTYRPMTLLHPLQFYFQKEQALKRKFQFYGVKLFRNYSVENNAPYFRVLMKRFFYHYKPSLRWERTLRVASTRRARRKNSRIPKKFNIEKSTQILAFESQKAQEKENFNLYNLGGENQKKDISDPTHFYSLVDKRASRYRFQIYKDVLQHWYYSPLNRFLLKLDIDSFIRRQPNSYFLTKNDEKFLHLKRQLLSEYYETLRWYTSMENYSSMKNQIGGTKSLSSRAYNQQFAGTLKKIRHLFNISPSFRENTVLKFDQPLYNEYNTFGQTALGVSNDSFSSKDDFFFTAENGGQNENNKKSVDSILHEELVSDNFFSNGETKNSKIQKMTSGKLPFSPSTSPENLVNQSITILREYLATVAPIRQQYIENLLKEKNYWELSRFVFRGQKIRGSRAVTNESDFLNQEKDLLFLDVNSNNSPQEHMTIPDQKLLTQFDPYMLKDEMWISLLKKCQKKLYDQEALKNYVSLKKEKYEIQKQRHEKYLKNRLTRIQEIVSQNSQSINMDKSQTVKNEISSTVENFEQFSGYPSSFKKAMKESILWENNSLSNSSFQTHRPNGNNLFSTYGKKLFLEKTNIRKNQFPMYSLLEKENIFSTTNIPFYPHLLPRPLPQRGWGGGEKQISTKMNNSKTKSFIFTKNLRFVIKKQALQILRAEKQVQKNFLRTPTPFGKGIGVASPFLEGSKKSKFFNFSTILKEPSQILFRKPKQVFLSFYNKVIGFQKTNFDQIEEENNKAKETSSLFTSVKQFVKKIFKWRQNNDSNFQKNKNIDFWKKRENILAKRKKLRKTLKRLRNQKTQTEKIVFENSDFFIPLSEQKNSKIENRQKADKNFQKSISIYSSHSWQNYLLQKEKASQGQNEKQKTLNFFGIPHSKIANTLYRHPQSGGGDKKFQRKRTRLRRYSSFKGRGPIKKRTLREKLKRQFKSLKKYGKTQNTIFSKKQKEHENKKGELIQFITQRNLAPNGKFLKRDEKQRKTRQIKHRAWKKKKQNFAQKRRKLRKRRRSTLSKIRVYNKKIYRILSRKEIQNWWWKTFFPHFQKITEKNWQNQKNKQIQKQLFDLSEKEIFERDQKNKENFKSFNYTQNEFNPSNFEKNFQQSIPGIDSLQIGNKDFKPFAIPEAFRIREKLVQENLLHFDQKYEKANEKSNSPTLSQNEGKTNLNEIRTPKQNYTSVPLQKMTENQKENFDMEIFEKVNHSLFVLQQGFNQNTKNLSNSPFLIATNPLPFYTGWDNGLRKFVLTNRLLTRKDCFSPQFSKSLNTKENFVQSPLQGMNAATTLYWQIPFTTYDPDQFFALGMDGFSPIGWRHFSFKHSKQTTKPILVNNFYSLGFQKSNTFSRDLRFKISQQTLSPKTPKSRFLKRNQEIDKNFEYRRILKKQKRLKKHPRPPVWFPSGSLSQQVLPVHYIYVFYKRSRLPRDRYIRRRLRTHFLNNQNSRQETSFLNNTKMIDFTLRKRTKPRRKYHRKRFGDFSEKNQFFAQRRKFRSFVDDTETNRPSSKFFLQTSGTKQEKKVLLRGRGLKQRRKIQDSKQPNENIRVRQLRRRVQRQVYRPVWRSRPRAGGFVWPGDYLRLESVKASPLKSTTTLLDKNETLIESEHSQSSARKIRKKTRRTLQEWQIQPKKYLFEKHNLKVLKKRIEKSMNFSSS